MNRIRVAALICALAVFALISGCTGISEIGSDPWPPSQSGLPVFYYFGDPG